ncbi:respiratory nitrate reductase chaperone NarJ [Cupriavidus sp. OV038]|jgi:nitrate reductase delta subunit|uniref:nitrate reductase molybdenum cofactor assembly chaperone n=1 Tax=unclassified Cupriavidus TaxID=2640874 RepID=UPI0008E5A214|nr:MULTISPECIES: nitrate reductase molybdenum cofactor assembly chaperone [unclassified Cupriavidus]SFD00223.1 respiratory nitrate reductase chaperone NarJ [Cupriavidus sp. OV038]SFP61001.1 respiratory nitrate reductase chaperone NarJ [Cupriavidus sp. OV096]
MTLYPVLSALLGYPEAPLQAAMPEIEQALDAWPAARAGLAPLTGPLRDSPLIALQEQYVATFDRNPAHSLHLFEHVHGESRDRGQAMVDLIDEYRRAGFEPVANELPDYVPLFLEFLGALADDGQAQRAEQLLGEAIHVLAAIGDRLARHDSPYATVFTVLRSMTSVQPEARTDPPVRDMDEALELFGPGTDGVEPLLAAAMPAEQVVRFHDRRAPSPQ